MKGEEPNKPVALEARSEDSDGRRHSPSIARNRDAVLTVFRKEMPGSGTVLELASGTGEHGAHIAGALPGLSWQYSDIDPESLASQHAWRAHAAGTANLLAPVKLNVTSQDWKSSGAQLPCDAMFCANMVHIAPFSAAAGLFSGAGRHLMTGGRLMLYGPFARNGVIAPSNARFSEDLKRRDETWGVRDLDQDLVPLSDQSGLKLKVVTEMPANNLSVIFERI